MQIGEGIVKRNWIIELSRKLMNEASFKDKHRASKEAFTRSRKLPFELVLVMILRKSVKSLQNVVNEAMFWLGAETVTASAICQARYKLLHTTFIELNQSRCTMIKIT